MSSDRPQNGKSPQQPPIQPQDQVRELTQTDKLNKKLLSSLFDRMNSQDDSTLNKMLDDGSQETSTQNSNDAFE